VRNTGYPFYLQHLGAFLELLILHQHQHLDAKKVSVERRPIRSSLHPRRFAYGDGFDVCSTSTRLGIILRIGTEGILVPKKVAFEDAIRFKTSVTFSGALYFHVESCGDCSAVKDTKSDTFV